jgi:hypothetical protein
MSTNMSATTALFAIALVLYLLYRQCVARAITRFDLLVPLGGALYLGARYMDGGHTPPAIGIVLGGAVLGILTGYASGGIVRVWRDERTGFALQHGGRRYAAVFLGLLLVRVALRVVAKESGLVADAAVLNDAFIAMLVGSVAGRAANVGRRALALLDWDLAAVPRRRDVRDAAIARYASGDPPTSPLTYDERKVRRGAAQRVRRTGRHGYERWL